MVGPVRASLRPLRILARAVWLHLPDWVLATRPFRAAGHFIHERYASHRHRIQSHYTLFMRNVPLYELIRDHVCQKPRGSSIFLISIGCSTGAELYSLLSVILAANPELQVLAQGMDLCGSVIRVAEKGEYKCDEPTTREALFGIDPEDPELRSKDLEKVKDLLEPLGAGWYQVKEQIRQKTTWRVGDGCDPNLLAALEPQDIVLANNWLGAMPDDQAEACIRSLAKLVAPGGCLVIDGADPDIKTKTIKSLNFIPVTQRIEQVYTADPSKQGWPWVRWAHEPLDRSHPDWQFRYAMMFKRAIDPRASNRPEAARDHASASTSQGQE